MKRVVSFLIISTFLIFGFMVKAKALTFEEVANKYKEKYNWVKIDAQETPYLQEIEDLLKVEVSNNSIIVTAENDDGSEKYTTVFNYKDGIIYYELDNKDINTTQIMINVVSKVKMQYVVAELRGYTIDQMIKHAEEMENNEFTMAKNGMEEIWVKNDNGMDIIKSFKIDINKFNLEGNLEGNKDIENSVSKQDEQINKDEELNKENVNTSKKSIFENLPINIWIAIGVLGVLILLIIILCCIAKKL